MSLLARRFPTLGRHLAVLRESWRRQNETDRTAKARIDHEFLPAALEIIEKPASPGLRILMLLLCALFAIALLWSVFGRVDVVAVATGRTIPVANVKLIQPSEIAVVRAIHVRNGQRVRRGELLIELDPTTAVADETQAAQGLLAARIAEARNDALLAHLAGRPPLFRPPPGISPDVVATQTELIRSKVAEYEAQRAALIQGRAQRAAELRGALAEIASRRQTLPLIDEQLAARRGLVERGHFPRLRMLEYEQLRIEHIQSIEVQESNAQRARAAIANIDAELAALRETLAEEASTELSTAETESRLRREELTKSARRRQLQQLRAPVDGTVQQLAVHTIGGVVQPAQPLMVIVPDGGQIEVEAQILNKDIGFVRVGQPVRVKLEAFPFTDYGWIEGTVETISRDAIQSSPELGREGAGAEQGRPGTPPSLVYAARIRLSRNYIMLGARRQPIGPGMAVQAEVRTGRRRIIQYLLSPISRTLDEAGRER
ncbi:HlyD family type I secretion periplasmic adaptor subunit [Sphingosinicella sp. LHD-64]|uniref:HlyD family type I secretion periplasmic adaptor subunit n=1 Tax=Sphingosinicella sp. LHD-64 TaxID=3072139 RepID=UPI00280F9A17|nr:HlyD family type I secretion periplasmic adaptor subunit [Sphingosinicella sp. LHD-64]MDQ8757645.1 HlyD family type I secretion periplasmic adaptor subunit [Sphingosinicella sp. LHD-64]